MKDMRCSRCILPENILGIKYDNNGVCNYCRKYEKDFSNWDAIKQRKKEEFEKLLTQAKRLKRTYDCPLECTPTMVCDYLTSPPARAVILRHDVDRAPERALDMARVEEDEMGVQGSYYFRWGTDVLEIYHLNRCV